jgi:alpha-galactosidase
MSGRIIVDTENSRTTTRNVPVFPWIRFDANLFIYEEAFIEGNYVGLHYSAMGRANTRERDHDKFRLAGSKYYRNHFFAFELEIDGQTLSDCWEWVGAKSSKNPDGNDESVVTLFCDMKKLRLEIHTLLDGSSFITRWLEIRNEGEIPFAISGASPWCGIVFTEGDISIATPDDYGFLLGKFRNMNWAMEGEFEWTKLPESTYKVESNKLCRFMPQYYIVKNIETGEMMVMDLAYTGGTCVEFSNYNFNADRHKKPWRGNYLHIKTGVAGDPPYYVLDPGNSVSTPAVHLSMLFGDLDTCTNELYGHLRRSVITRPNALIKNPVQYNYAGYSECVPTDIKMITKEIDMAADIGAELFMVDAGWYGADLKPYYEVFGDWHENALLDGRLAECFGYARQKGMMCGLWTAIEIVGPSSEIYREHPEWCMADGDRKILMLDILQPDVELHMTDTVIRLIEKYKLDCFRIDGGPEQFYSWRKNNGKYIENIVWKYYDKLNDIFDKIQKLYPDLYLENCWGGGGRNDRSMMKRFHWMQITDNWHPEEQLRILNGVTLAFPPEQCQIFTGAVNMNPVDTDFSLRAGMFGQNCIVGFFPSSDKYNIVSFERWKHAVKLYKEEIRDILPDCRVFHHTPLQDYRKKGDWVVLEYAGDDRSKIIVGIFRLADSEKSEYIFVSKGSDISRDYRLWFDNRRCFVTVSGLRLCTTGIAVDIPGNMMSELLIIKAI